MAFFTDQIGKTIAIAHTPQRIVSLVPSQTELLYHLGLDKEVAGITKFCIHPAHWFRSKARIGGTKKVHLDKVHQINPDLIIANKEENVKEEVESLAARFPVWTSDINNLNEAISMIQSLGEITGTMQRATTIAQQIDASFQALPIGEVIPVAYLIWKDPYMTVGGDTFINDMLERAGYRNVFCHLKRYPVVSVEAIHDSGAQTVFLSSEPYPFKQQHLDEMGTAIPGVKPVLVDGEMFSWYGSRLLYAAPYFEQLRREIGLFS